MELCNMLAFGEYIQMKNKDLHGSDIRKSEYAGIRAVLEVVKENYKFIVDNEKRKIIDEFIEKLMGSKNGNGIRNKDSKAE